MICPNPHHMSVAELEMRTGLSFPCPELSLLCTLETSLIGQVWLTGSHATTGIYPSVPADWGGGVKRKKGNTHMHLPAPPSRVGPSGTKAPPSLLQADMLREDLLLLLQLFPLLRYLFKLNFESSKRNANIMKHNF